MLIFQFSIPICSVGYLHAIQPYYSNKIINIVHIVSSSWFSEIGSEYMNGMNCYAEGKKYVNNSNPIT